MSDNDLRSPQQPPERRTSRLVIAMYVMQGIMALIVAGGLLMRLLQGQ